MGLLYETKKMRKFLNSSFADNVIFSTCVMQLAFQNLYQKNPFDIYLSIYVNVYIIYFVAICYYHSMILPSILIIVDLHLPV